MLGALFGFKGRLSRPGYWEVLFSIVLIDVLLVLGRMYVADSGLPGGHGPSSPLSQDILAAVPWVLGVFTVWSLLAAMVKRCHDRGRPGALILIGLIPVIGWAWLLIDLFVLEGEERKNRYGRPPHAPAVESTPRAAFEWGAEPAAAAASPEPEFAAAPFETPAPEPAEAEPAPIDAGAVDVHVQEPPPAPQLEAEPETPVAVRDPAPEAPHVEAAEPEPVHAEAVEPEPAEPVVHADEPAPVEAAAEEAHEQSVAAAEPEQAEAPPAETEEAHQPELALSLDPEPAYQPHAHGDLRPLMLDGI